MSYVDYESLNRLGVTNRDEYEELLGEAESDLCLCGRSLEQEPLRCGHCGCCPGCGAGLGDTDDGLCGLCARFLEMERRQLVRA